MGIAKNPLRCYNSWFPACGLHYLEGKRMGSDGDLLVVLVTAPTEELGARIASRLVTDGLAACVSRFDVKSVYRWEGEIHQDDEIQLIIKTTRSALETLKKTVLEMHEYDVPEIIAIPVTDGYPPYLKWISESTGEEGLKDA